MPTSSLSISVLGPLHVTVKGAPVSDFKYNKARALLAYLAMQVGAPQPRAELCALLWPELPEKSARRNLTQVLTALRDALGENETAPEWLLTNTESVQLNPDVTLNVDAARFGALLDDSERHAHRSWLTCHMCAERLHAAMTLYRGDFLSQIFVADSAPFEEWALLWRERLRQRALSALERLAQRAEWRGDYGAAVALARRQVELDSLREVSHRELVRLLALDGQASAAEAQYEQLRRMLTSELSVEPEAETTRLHERIRAGQLDAAHLRRHAAPPVNGPVAPNALIGREDDVQEVCQPLRADAIRVLTLTGAPGIGKTRLALEAAHALRFDFEDGVHFVELAPVAEAALVMPAIAQALGVKEPSGVPLTVALTAHLKSKHALLVLDNFEHVLEAAALVAGLLAACPAVKALITSRAPLRIRAEQQHALAPLAEAEAVQLFSERARAARPTFTLTPENAETVAALCEQLDHLPLAIELIAVRARTLSLTELRQQLDQPLDALSHGARDLPGRHRTLRDAIGWSFDRLSADEQRVFAHLGVFAGGSTAEAAQAVLGVSPPALPSLEALIEASLVQAHVVAGETRFTLLETIREYALERITATRDGAVARERHALYFQALAERAEPELDGPDQGVWLEKLNRDYANIREALTWGLAHSAELALRLAAALRAFWKVQGRMSEGRRALQQALQLAPTTPTLYRARALNAASTLTLLQGDLAETKALLVESYQLHKLHEDAPGLALTLAMFGDVEVTQGNYAEARPYLENGLELARQAHYGFAESVALHGLGLMKRRQGDYAAARRLTEQLVDTNRRMGSQRGLAGALINLSLVADEMGDNALAQQKAEESLVLFRELNDRYGVSVVLNTLGLIFLKQDDLAQAERCFEEALAIRRADGYEELANPMTGLGRVQTKLGHPMAARAHHASALQLHAAAGDRRGVAVALRDLAQTDYDQGRPERAAQLLGAAEAIRESLGAPIPLALRADYNALVSVIQANLGESVFTRAWAAGRALTPEQAVALALN
jgi:predicted ATPase/DNA-binding SARP family transcriptional activator